MNKEPDVDVEIAPVSVEDVGVVMPLSAPGLVADTADMADTVPRLRRDRVVCTSKAASSRCIIRRDRSRLLSKRAPILAANSVCNCSARWSDSLKIQPSDLAFTEQ